MLDSLSEFLAPPRCRDVLALLRGAFCLACVALVLRACFHFAPYRVGHRVRLMLFPALFCIGALAIFVYQASWQLAGHTRKSFVSYMERHNSRPDNAAHHLIRGASTSTRTPARTSSASATRRRASPGWSARRTTRSRAGRSCGRWRT